MDSRKNVALHVSRYLTPEGDGLLHDIYDYIKSNISYKLEDEYIELGQEGAIDLARTNKYALVVGNFEPQEESGVLYTRPLLLDTIGVAHRKGGNRFVMLRIFVNTFVRHLLPFLVIIIPICVVAGIVLQYVFTRKWSKKRMYHGVYELATSMFSHGDLPSFLNEREGGRLFRYILMFVIVVILFYTTSFLTSIINTSMVYAKTHYSTSSMTVSKYKGLLLLVTDKTNRWVHKKEVHKGELLEKYNSTPDKYVGIEGSVDDLNELINKNASLKLFKERRYASVCFVASDSDEGKKILVEIERVLRTPEWITARNDICRRYSSLAVKCY